MSIVPFQVGDGPTSWCRAICLIKLFELHHNEVHNFKVSHSLSQRLHCLVAPLCPAATITYAPFFLIGTGCRQNEDFGFNTGWVGIGSAPELSSLVHPYIGRDEPVEVAQGFTLAIRIGAAYRRVLSPAPETFNLTFAHCLKHPNVRIVYTGVTLGQIMKAKVIVLVSCISIPCLKQAHHILTGIAPPVGALITNQTSSCYSGIRMFPGSLYIGTEVSIAFHWHIEIPGQDVR